MSSTRSFTSLGVVAKNATPVNAENDPDRVVGTPYRNTDLTSFQVAEGERFNIPPVSEDDNQKLFNQSSFTDVIDRRGIVGWSNLVDYEKPALVYASDGNFYTCKKANGPSTFIVDPITDDQDAPVYWLIYKNSTALALDLANQTPGNEGSRLVGYTNMTVFQAIYGCYNKLFNSNHIQILASVSYEVRALDGYNNTEWVIEPNVFNVESVTVYSMPYRITHTDIVFENDIDENYSVLTFAETPLSSTVISVGGASGASYTYNKTASGISLGTRYRTPYSTDSTQDSFNSEFQGACLIAYKLIP